MPLVQTEYSHFQVLAIKDATVVVPPSPSSRYVVISSIPFHGFRAYCHHESGDRAETHVRHCLPHCRAFMLPVVDFLKMRISK